MRKSCWARSLAAVVFVGALFFGFAEAEAVHLEDGAVIDYDITGLGNVEVGRDTPEIVSATVDFMPASEGKTGAITAGTINVGNSGTVNMYGGQYDSEWGAANEGYAEISLAAEAAVTFYGTSFIVGGDVIDEGTESVVLSSHTAGIWGAYSVVWTGADENVYDIWVLAGTGVAINLSMPGVGTNIAPVADAGGPYAVVTTSMDGALVTLDASGSSDEDGAVVSYKWDIDGDGFTDVTTAVFDLDAPIGVSEVTLIVLDDEGLASEPVTATITVTFVEPEIDVDVEELSYDFGDVAIGESKTFVIPIYNLGDSDLTVTSVSLVGDADFAIIDGPAEPIVIVPSELEGVDIEVTFTPSAEGLVSVIVVIASDDADESVVEVILDGCGIVVVVPPEQQIQNILDFYDESVDNGTIIGNAPGRSCRISRAERRVRVLRNMIKSAGDMINLNLNCLAVRQLKSVAKKTDGERRPPDFVVGDSVAELNTMVNELIADLTL